MPWENSLVGNSGVGTKMNHGNISFQKKKANLIVGR